MQRLTLFVLTLGLTAALGCAGYRSGAETLYPPDIHTIYVPIFESDSFRRNMGERLTEAVVKRIEQVTPYKVVSGPDADTILRGHIVNETKRIIIEDVNDQPRESEVNLVARVSWVDSRGDVPRTTQDIQIPVDLAQSALVIPEYGQSLASAQQKAIDGLARQIVNMMETPW
jgi:hypothetical protein